MITTDYTVAVMSRNQTSLVAMITTDYTVDVMGRNQTSLVAKKFDSCP
jgi:hypothetical protein